VTSFEDLEVGMKAVVAGDEIDTGHYKAIAVGAGAPQGALQGERPGQAPAGPGI
jgi:hypothetical protein